MGVTLAVLLVSLHSPSQCLLVCIGTMPGHQLCTVSRASSLMINLVVSISFVSRIEDVSPNYMGSAAVCPLHRHSPPLTDGLIVCYDLALLSWILSPVCGPRVVLQLLHIYDRAALLPPVSQGVLQGPTRILLRLLARMPWFSFTLASAGGH